MPRADYHQVVLDSSPGRFEGEPDWTPYFYDFYLNGDPGEYEEPDVCKECTCDDWMDCEAMDNPVSVYDVEPEDIAIFPELADAKQIRLWQTEQGFICTELVE